MTRSNQMKFRQFSGLICQKLHTTQKFSFFDKNPSENVNFLVFFTNYFTFMVQKAFFSIQDIKGEVHSKMAGFFLFANKKIIQRKFMHQNLDFQRAFHPFEILVFLS